MDTVYKSLIMQSYTNAILQAGELIVDTEQDMLVTQGTALQFDPRLNKIIRHGMIRLYLVSYGNFYIPSTAPVVKIAIFVEHCIQYWSQGESIPNSLYTFINGE